MSLDLPCCLTASHVICIADKPSRECLGIQVVLVDDKKWGNAERDLLYEVCLFSTRLLNALLSSRQQGMVLMLTLLSLIAAANLSMLMRCQPSSTIC